MSLVGMSIVSMGMDRTYPLLSSLDKNDICALPIYVRIWLTWVFSEHITICWYLQITMDIIMPIFFFFYSLIFLLFLFANVVFFQFIFHIFYRNFKLYFKQKEAQHPHTKMLRACLVVSVKRQDMIGQSVFIELAG